MKKKRSIVIILCVLLLGIGLNVLANKFLKNGQGFLFIINKMVMANGETEEYKSKLKETKYKNYKILHNEDVETALPLIFYYLDKLENENNELLGYIPESELTIQIDYDKEVFNSRTNLGDGVEGVYNPVIKTLYIYVEDVYHQVISNMYHTEMLEDGSFSRSNISFSDILAHEYSHYATNDFIEKNNISKDLVPVWFHEGIAEYISKVNKSYGEELSFIQLSDLTAEKEWAMAMDNENIVTEPYIQSMYAIYTIVNLKGEIAIRDIILNCNNSDFSKAFETIMEISLEEFENNLKNDFKNYNDMYSEFEYYSDRDSEVVIGCLEEYIKENENDIRAYIMLINMYEGDRTIDTIIAFIELAIEKNPEEATLWRRLGWLYEKNNMIQKANECYLKADEIDNFSFSS